MSFQTENISVRCTLKDFLHLLLKIFRGSAAENSVGSNGKNKSKSKIRLNIKIEHSVGSNGKNKSKSKSVILRPFSLINGASCPA